MHNMDYLKQNKRSNSSFRQSGSPSSFNRKTGRKPIFDNQMYYTNVKPFEDPHFSGMHIIQITQDDFCGCQQNLEPCQIIQSMLKGVKQNDMRRQYDQLQNIELRRYKSQLKRKYFKFLPSYYPQLYHAHLTNILSNIQEELTLNQFMALAWIQYHSKLEHITYFLYCDLRKSLKGKQKFKDSLQLQLINHELTLTSLIQSAKNKKIPFMIFLDDFYESIAAIIIPLSQYARFIRLLLRRGTKVMLQLLIILVTNKRESFFDLLEYYSSGVMLRQKTRQFSWQLLFGSIQSLN